MKMNKFALFILIILPATLIFNKYLPMKKSITKESLQEETLSEAERTKIEEMAKSYLVNQANFLPSTIRIRRIDENVRKSLILSKQIPPNVSHNLFFVECFNNSKGFTLIIDLEQNKVVRVKRSLVIPGVKIKVVSEK